MRLSNPLKTKTPSAEDIEALERNQKALEELEELHRRMKLDSSFYEVVPPGTSERQETSLADLQLRHYALSRRRGPFWRMKDVQNWTSSFRELDDDTNDLDFHFKSTSRLLESMKQQGIVTAPSTESYEYSDGRIRWELNMFTAKPGGFGKVWPGTLEPSGKSPMKVALKALHKNKRLSPENLLSRVSREAVIWSALADENVAQFITLLDLRQTALQNVVLVSVWSELGTAVDYLQEEANANHTLPIIEDIISGLAYLHKIDLPDKCAVYHGDMKGDNVLIFPPPPGSNRPVAKITDFGQSKIVDPDIRSATQVGGHRYYLAPEIHRGLEAAERTGVKAHLSSESDVWAFALTAWELITRLPPFSYREQTSLGMLYVQGSPSSVDEEIYDLLLSVPKALRPFLTACLSRDPAQRPTMAQVKKDWSALLTSQPELASKPWLEVMDELSAPAKYCNYRFYRYEDGPRDLYKEWSQFMLDRCRERT
ncbi:kinase-like protein [Sistotremastrum suecicum HHB10207 ss-3]|uniref:Kinase-like protein n=1 Tax=Sistotremastrum suecicum HHB10207 ss-3 TaxID=1314776 RepID=A0A166FWW3_9AGAM|nr:kinase-like protein [Sistotremastrum suecicum HHB10207 ss-3]